MGTASYWIDGKLSGQCRAFDIDYSAALEEIFEETNIHIIEASSNDHCSHYQNSLLWANKQWALTHFISHRNAQWKLIMSFLVQFTLECCSFIYTASTWRLHYFVDRIIYKENRIKICNDCDLVVTII